MSTNESLRNSYLWHYVPSLPLAIAFASLFGILTIGHAWRTFSTRLWFCSGLVVGGAFEVIGYGFRAVAHNATGALIPYIMQALFTLIPPILFAASQYMCYSRLVRAVGGESVAPLSIRWSTRLFVFGDIACLLIQSSGSGLLVKAGNAQIGTYIIVAGLILQIVVFVVFVTCCAIFHRRFGAQPHSAETVGHIRWRSCLWMLYTTSMLILGRNLYRVVEFAMGMQAYLYVNEWPTYVLDAAPMFLVMLGFLIWYPTQIRAGTIKLATQSQDQSYDNVGLRDVSKPQN